MLTLRDYQQEMIDKVIDSLKQGYRKIMIVLPTGGGKTAIASELVRRSYAKGKSSIFMCHRQELLDQTYDTYGKNGIIPAFIKGGRHPDYDNPMQIASVNTLVRRLDKYKVPDIVFVDECFVENTEVLTSDGYKKIKNIKAGDFVKTFNEKTKQLEYKRVLKLIKKERKEDLVCVSTGNRNIICTENHLFFTKNNWKKAKDLTVNDYLLNEYFNFIQIKSITNVKKNNEDYVYDLTVEDNHNYFVEGILVHNCHHSKAGQWSEILNWAGNAVVVGLTATPCRLDGKPLNDMYDKMIEVVTTKQLIDRGYLVPYLYYAPSIIDTSELVTANGDYTKKSLESASFNAKIIGDNIEQYKKIANGKRNVVFAISRKHAKSICDRYIQAGIPARVLDGTDNPIERKKTIELFRKGDIKVVVSIDVISEGFDLPAIEVVSLLRPTQSTALYLQQVGRALRTCPEIGKQTAIILDHVNNYKTHGLPDEERIWSLDGGYKGRKRGASSDIKIRRCPNCFYAHSPALVCPNCGYKYGADGEQIQEVAGELALVGSQEYKDLQRKEVILADSLEELVRIERSRRFKFGWAEKQWELKTGIKLKSSFSGLEEIAAARGYNHSWAWVQWQRIRRG